MSKILVAIDGLPGSEKALEAAVKLAQKDEGQVAAVSVLEYTADPQLDRLLETVKDQARRRLEETLQAASNFAHARGVQLTPILREGHPAEAILTCAEQEGADLLVLGSRNRSAPHSGLGGTADQISAHSSCTVMIVK